MLSHRTKRVLLQLLPFGIFPAIFSVIYGLLEKGILGDNPTYPSTGNPYSFQVFVPTLLAFSIGILMGIFEVFYINKWFQKKSFTRKIISKSIFYFVALIIASLTSVVVSHAVDLGVGLFDKQIWNFAAAFTSSFAFWSVLLYFTLAITLCLFYVEVSGNIGQAVLLNFFTGKYHQPLEEERVYMFLDMKSSTTIAERLGHVRYFEMLKEYYIDLSDPIIDYGGEIYQYVGDEVIVTWKVKPGFANNALHCFFAMKVALQQQVEKYQSTYGVVPSFKAGIHFGRVTTGEIGVIKKEITFSGDVLNTTARIQGLCNAYQVDLLISEKLANALEPNGTLEAKSMGEAELRGRNEKVGLYTVERIKH
ncbi:MAG: adenylate/guanylate cyclase domain-containing protein [Bacteroidota bacterium]